MKIDAAKIVIAIGIIILLFVVIYVISLLILVSRIDS